jgi:hypothetical protein
VKLPIHVIEHDISQKGRNDSTLRGADRSRLKDTVFHYSGLEKFFDEPENITIGDFLSHRIHDDVMPEIVEKSGNVGVKHEAQPAAMESNKGVESLMGVSILNVSKGRFVEHWFEDRGQETTNDLLSYPVSDRWNAERTKLRFIFGNENPTKGFGLKRTLFKNLHKGLEIVLKIRFEHLDANLINTCGPPISFDRLKSGHH